MNWKFDFSPDTSDMMGNWSLRGVSPSWFRDLFFARLSLKKILGVEDLRFGRMQCGC